MDKVKKTIRKRKLFKNSTPLLIMVSGGSDSVALVYILSEIHNGPKAIMHVNHMLRDKDSERDAKFVEQLAKKLDYPFYSYKINIQELAEKRKTNIEATGHHIRYKYALNTIDDWSKKLNANKDNIRIVTAHTSDDRIENFYMRSIVGTGPGGFASISYKNGQIVRPLLDVNKESLQKYLISKNITWVEDKTNQDEDRFRAYVRKNIIPLAKRKNPKIYENLVNSMNLIADESKYLEKQVSKTIEKHVQFDETSCLIKPEFKDEDLVIQRRTIYNILKHLFPEEERINTKSIQSIIDAVNTHNYTDNIQYNYSVHSNNKGVLIQPMELYREQRNRN